MDTPFYLILLISNTNLNIVKKFFQMQPIDTSALTCWPPQQNSFSFSPRAAIPPYSAQHDPYARPYLPQLLQKKSRSPSTNLLKPLSQTSSEASLSHQQFTHFLQRKFQQTQLPQPRTSHSLAKKKKKQLDNMMLRLRAYRNQRNTNRGSKENSLLG